MCCVEIGFWANYSVQACNLVHAYGGSFIPSLSHPFCSKLLLTGHSIVRRAPAGRSRVALVVEAAAAVAVADTLVVVVVEAMAAREAMVVAEDINRVEEAMVDRVAMVVVVDTSRVDMVVDTEH